MMATARFNQTAAEAHPMTTPRRVSTTELAHRSGDGVDVTLLWLRGDGAEETLVCVTDHRNGAYFEIRAAPYLALDVYYHPFAYRDFSTIDCEDSHLAA
jgi:hypothetical protein